MSSAGADWREVIDSYPCPTCGAAPGDGCVSYSNIVKREPHAPRSRLAHDNGWQYAEKGEPRAPADDREG